jgi:hypothetical protein
MLLILPTPKVMRRVSSHTRIIMSPDEKQLYVAPREQPEVIVYPIRSPGQLGKGRIFHELRTIN